MAAGSDGESSRRKEGKSILDQLDWEHSAYIGGIIEFGKLLTSNLILINAGGIVALPAYAQLFHDPSASIVWAYALPALIFALGLVSAGVSGFCSFKCYSKGAAKKHYEKLIILTGKRNSDDPLHIEEKVSRIDRSIRTYYHWSISLGWLSLAFFFLGCSVFGIEVLAKIRA